MVPARVVAAVFARFAAFIATLAHKASRTLGVVGALQWALVVEPVLVATFVPAAFGPLARFLVSIAVFAVFVVRSIVRLPDTLARFA